ncbi:BON domain-containing protein [Mucilaginibacter flavidus]|uniref:BON domain-containing protein n=1 Tax=Mucilaginibacter flavidus TaxID=2949309 RepID=UPI002093C1DD|nr:BON domain-containing protein [Mucilaginibacter flavidus]MCO5946602.1 BON domain-containing protein [Mucilaginibacter flavidus]
MRADDKILKYIREELKWEPLLHDLCIAVAVKNGIVTLSGKTSGYRARRAATQAAGRVKGVKIIVDKIEVCLPVYDCLDDRIINIEITNALHWHGIVPSDKITATVKHGIVTLTGEADEPYQLETAINAISHLRGIKDIINHITIQQHPDALHRHREQAPGEYHN